MSPEHSERMGAVWVSAVAVILTVAILAGIVAGSITGCGAIRSWERGQKRANARNSVALTRIQIQNQEQYARVINAQNQVVYQQAQQRVIEANGISKAQSIIAGSLTPAYLQYEAIKSQQAIATSGQNNSIIYVPSGTNGVPIVQTAQVPVHKP